jgi:hypothetical protein
MALARIQRPHTQLITEPRAVATAPHTPLITEPRALATGPHTQLITETASGSDRPKRSTTEPER